MEYGLRYRLVGVWLVLVFSVAPWVMAEKAPADAYSLVEKTTNRVMEIVKAAPAGEDADLEEYYAQLQEVLEEVVDFSAFARAVMGPFAGRDYYRSLDAEAKARLRAQAERFTARVRVGLARTYGKGLLAFGGSRAEVQRSANVANDSGKISVTQHIYRGSREPYVIRYQMRRNRAGQWKLRNLIVESINLGQIYRNQFQAAARDAGGDLDQVIDNWSAVEVSGQQ
ncbi:MAG: ABC transporter substrate-binding protein [Halieaceae bacterium]|nr:ABC transporter substrate-binding protein [Halieaceae bacterium]